MSHWGSLCTPELRELWLTAEHAPLPTSLGELQLSATRLEKVTLVNLPDLQNMHFLKDLPLLTELTLTNVGGIKDFACFLVAPHLVYLSISSPRWKCAMTGLAQLLTQLVGLDIWKEDRQPSMIDFGGDDVAHTAALFSRYEFRHLSSLHCLGMPKWLTAIIRSRSPLLRK